MLRLKQIAVTGNVASGKTTVCRIFQQLGAYLFNADSAGQTLISNDHDTINQIRREFGLSVFEGDKISRKKLASVVFTDAEKLLILEKILHPKIHSLMERERDKANGEGYALFIAEIPLLYEVGWEKEFDATVVVARERSLREASCMYSDFSARESRLISEDAKIAKADFVINNSGSEERLLHICKDIFTQIQGFKRSTTPHAR